MPNWMWSWWIWQWLGFVLIGAGLVSFGLLFLHRRATRDGAPSSLTTADYPPRAEINISRVMLGGDVAGLLVMVGVIVALLPVLWGWFLVVAIAALLFSGTLFLWHRYHPW